MLTSNCNVDKLTRLLRSILDKLVFVKFKVCKSLLLVRSIDDVIGLNSRIKLDKKGEFVTSIDVNWLF
jgi:hypothetical protein